MFSSFSPDGGKEGGREGEKEGGRHASGQMPVIALRVTTTWIIRGAPSPWPVMELTKQTHMLMSR